MQILALHRYEEENITGHELKDILLSIMRSSQNLLNNPRLSPMDRRYLDGKVDMATTLLSFVLRLYDGKIKGEEPMELTLAKKPLTIDEAGLRAGNGEVATALLELAEKMKPGETFPLNAPGIKIENIGSTLYHLRKAQRIGMEFGIRKKKDKDAKGKTVLIPHFVRLEKPIILRKRTGNGATPA